MTASYYLMKDDDDGWLILMQSADGVIAVDYAKTKATAEKKLQRWRKREAEASAD